MSKLGNFWKSLFGFVIPAKDQGPKAETVQQVIPPAVPALPLRDRGGQRPIIPASINGMDMSRGKL